MKNRELKMAVRWCAALGALLLLGACGKRGTSVNTAVPDQIITTVKPVSPDEGGIRIFPFSGELSEQGSITVTFPTDMADKDLIGTPAECPVTFEPPVTGMFFEWVTPRRGRISVGGANTQKVAYRAQLRTGLTDLAGQPISQPNWGAEFAVDQFGLAKVSFAGVEDYDESPLLPAMPRVSLEFTRNVIPSAVARQIVFQDAESHDRIPVVVALHASQPDAAQGWFQVEPSRPLPPDREFLLVVERLEDKPTQQKLPHLRVFKAGKTRSTKATWANGYNQPRKGAFLRVGFNGWVDAEVLNASFFSVTPPVANVKTVMDGNVVELHGSFEKGKTYAVTLAKPIPAADGQIVPVAGPWNVAIPEQRAALIMPYDTITARPSDGIKLAFGQFNTREVKWQIARVPIEKLLMVKSRLREFGEFQRDNEGVPALDPRTRQVRYVDTEFLVDSLSLEVLKSGDFASSPQDKEVQRSVEWKPGSGEIGHYLVEVRSRTLDGRQIGNRTLVALTDQAIIRSQHGDQNTIRLVNLNTAKPIGGVPVELFKDDGASVLQVVTDAEGRAELPGKMPGGGYFVAGSGATRHFQSADLGNFTRYYDSSDEEYNEDPTDRWVGVTYTPGDVFSPGDTVRVKVIVRAVGKDGVIQFPKAGPAEFEVFGPDYQSGKLPIRLNANGGGEGQWQAPALVQSGAYQVIVDTPEGITNRIWPASIVVTEFRPPTFSVNVRADDSVGETVKATVHSDYFHGQPNRGAQVVWRAEWDFSTLSEEFSEEEEMEEPAPNVVDWTYYATNDVYSQEATRGMEPLESSGAKGIFESPGATSPMIRTAVVRGQGVLDEEGNLVLSAKCPFPPASRLARGKVTWLVDVITPEGNSRRGVKVQTIQIPKQSLAIQSEELASDEAEIRLESRNLDNTAGSGVEADLDVYRLDVKTAREAVSDNVVRYRNSLSYTKVGTKRVTTPGRWTVSFPSAGDYVVVARSVTEPECPPVSALVFVSGGTGEFAVTNAHSFSLETERPTYQVGDVARLKMRAPFSGMAYPVISKGKNVWHLPPVELQGNAGVLEVPILREYYPNAFCHVHLVKTGRDGAPAEVSGECAFEVRDSGRELAVKVELAQNIVRPGESAAGTVIVASAGAPAARMEVSLFAVDEAVLSLGNWNAPELLPLLFPKESDKLSLFRGIANDWSPVAGAGLSHSEKGFFLGDKGDSADDLAALTFRQNRNPRPLWVGAVQTDAAGQAAFSFKAPDSLTAYRVVAFAHDLTRYGVGASKQTVTKDVRLLPVTPDFVRTGDELQMRVRVEQSAVAEMRVAVSVTAESGVELIGSGAQDIDVPRDRAAVLTFPVRIVGKPGSDAVVSFVARPQGASASPDAVRLSMPVHSQFVVIREGVSGRLAGGESWNVGASIPERWRAAEGIADVFLSGTSWLSRVAGLQMKNLYGGSTADISAALVQAVLLPEVYAYMAFPQAKRPATPPSEEGESELELPDGLKREMAKQLKELFSTLAESRHEFENGGYEKMCLMSRWPRGREMDEPATLMAAFAVGLARESEWLKSIGVSVPSRLDTQLSYWREGVFKPGRRPFDLPKPTPFIQAAVLYLETRDPQNMEKPEMEAFAKNLFENRELLEIEGRAFLAMAMHAGEMMPEQLKTLVSELMSAEVAGGFERTTLKTPIREQAIRLFSLVTVQGDAMEASQKARIEALMVPVRNASVNLSAQENVWMLLAAQAAMQSEDPAVLAEQQWQTAPIASANGVTLGWLGQSLAGLTRTFRAPLSPNVEASWFLQAASTRPLREAGATAGLKIQRNWQNLSAPGRDGKKEPPQLGDQILITVRVEADAVFDCVELDQQLPAGFEHLNSDLPAVRKAFKMAADSEDLPLAWADARLEHVKLYFDQIPKGTHQTSILVRVVGAGEFAWPGCTMRTLYDRSVSAWTSDTKLQVKAP